MLNADRIQYVIIAKMEPEIAWYRLKNGVIRR